jgi:xanthine dehydrogenase accessory factor
MFDHLPVFIRGAGDLASGVALRLHRSGFPVIMAELERPLVVRRTVAFAQAVFEGTVTVEGVEAQHSRVEDVPDLLARRRIPLLVDPTAQTLHRLRPPILVDGIMAKRNTGTHLGLAPLVIALGPGFVAGQDCHAVVETNRGHNLGRVIWQGPAEADTGTPGTLPGLGPNTSRVLRSPAVGQINARYAIGDWIEQSAVIATINGADVPAVPIPAPFAGVLRGLVHGSVPVTAGMKIGDLDPRAEPEYCFTVSDKSLAIGGGVLEAILTAVHQGLLPLP